MEKSAGGHRAWPDWKAVHAVFDESVVPMVTVLDPPPLSPGGWHAVTPVSVSPDARMSALRRRNDVTMIVVSLHSCGCRNDVIVSRVSKALRLTRGHSGEARQGWPCSDGGDELT